MILFIVFFQSFTFYCSSIRRADKKGVEIEPVTALHSTVALLEASFIDWYRSFISGFTFYCSSIRSSTLPRVSDLSNLFTFYCSSIRSHCFCNLILTISSFTFYCSSIRSLCRASCKWLYRPLHSTVALLEGVQGLHMEDDPRALHSTVALLEGF